MNPAAGGIGAVAILLSVVCGPHVIFVASWASLTTFCFSNTLLKTHWCVGARLDVSLAAEWPYHRITYFVLAPSPTCRSVYSIVHS